MYDAVGMTPDIQQLPGATQLQNLIDGLGAWALLAAMVALIIGAVVWALGAHSQNVHQSMAGRRAVVASVAAALLIGAAPHIVNFFFSTGQGVR
jgi:hypothetical protein